MSEAAHHTAEAIAASAASKSMYTGAGITLGGWWTSNEFLGLAGLLIATLGFATNWYYKHKLTRAILMLRPCCRGASSWQQSARSCGTLIRSSSHSVPTI